MPPLAVRMASATCIPWMSSGEVSLRTRTTFLPFAESASARSAVVAITPVPPPGPAGRPRAITFAFASAAGSIRLWSSSSSCSGRTRMRASSRAMSPSSHISTAMRTAAAPLRFPVRVWSIHSRPSSIVNSMSCMSRKCFSSVSRIRTSSPYASGMDACRVSPADGDAPWPFSGLGVRMPATTSSPWALGSHSP